jgi:two-component system chemotaxis response regulator CheB
MLAVGLAPITLLVVDDSAAFRRRVTRHLDEDCAIAVVGQADNGADALREIDRLRPDVVLLDLYMPPPDGFEVLRAVKRRFHETCVVVLTSDTSPLVRERCETLSADAVIDKADAATLMIPTLRRMAARRGERDAG